MNFTWDGLKSANMAYMNLVKGLSKHKAGVNLIKSPAGYKELFKMYIEDDLNTPKVLAFIWELIRGEPSKDVYKLIIEIDKVLSLGLEDAVKEYLEKQNSRLEVPDEVRRIADNRVLAKQNKDFAGADMLRGQIREFGYEIVDLKDGYELKKL